MFKVKSSYTKPVSNVRSSMMRTNILAGSVDNGTFNGESQAHVRGEDFTFGSRRRLNESID